MKIWTERPARTVVEAVVRRYFALLQGGKFSEVEQLIDDTSVRHVLRSLWTASVRASGDADEANRSPAADDWEQDSSWLGELDLADFQWRHEDSGCYVRITYRARIIEVALSFWVKPTDAGWVLSGPATLW